MTQAKLALPVISQVLLALFLVASSYGQQERSVKEPYSLNLVASRSSQGIEVHATIQSLDLRKYPLPTSIKQFIADPDDGPKYHVQKFTADNVPLVNGVGRVVLRGYDMCQDFQVRIHIQVDGWRDEHLECRFHLPSKPDLRIERIVSPEEVFSNTPFNVETTIREINGDTDATTTVTLYEGTSVLASVSNVAVPRGNKVNVVFPGISSATAGRHYYTVKISNTNPEECDVTNNSRSFAVNVVARPDLSVERIAAPDNVFSNATFDIHAYIRESGGTTAKATVSLYDGAILVGSFSHVEVHARSLERVTFRGISSATPGQHVYTVAITNSNPTESDLSNNTAKTTVAVLLRPDLRVESASAPSPVFIGSFFDITAVIREHNGQSGASAFVGLFEGRDLQASPVKVTLSAGGTVQATFKNIKEYVTGIRTYTIKIFAADPCESNEGNNSYSFTVPVVKRPDLKVEKVIVPSSVTAGIPFPVDAVIKEIDGQSGSVATITLLEGNSVLAAKSGISVPAAGNVTVSFTNITASTAGTHTYSVKITDAVPSESDVTNNSYSFSLSAAAKPDLRVDNLTAPSSVPAGTPFNVSASVKEYLGIVGATASVALYDGTTPVGAAQAISVSAGGSVAVQFSGIVASTSGVHTFAVKISGAVPAEWDVTNNERTFTINVLPKPDLVVEQLIIPAELIANTPFDVQVVIRELTGSSITTASVSLYEGTNLLSGPQSISVPAGGSTTALFHGIIATTSGTHRYTAVITGATPVESIETNNSTDLQVLVNELTTTELQPGLMSYSFESYDHAEITARTYSQYDHTVLNYWETSSLELRVSLPAGQALESIDEISWEIRTANGTYDSYAVQNANPPIGKPAKNIEVTINNSSNPVEIVLRQTYAFSHVVDSWVPTDVTTGNQAFVLKPEGSLEVTLRLRSRSNLYTGTTSLAVPAPQPIGTDSYRYQRLGEAGEDPTGPYIEEWTRRRSTSASTEALTVAALETALKSETDRNEAISLPGDFEMLQNYPNPFNPTTTFEFALPTASFVSLKVYDILAREVATVLSQEFTAGRHKVRWNASSLPSGLYIYRVRAGEFVAQKKLVLVK